MTMRSDRGGVSRWETTSLLPRSYQFGTDKPKCSVVACSAVETISNEKLAGTLKKV